MRQGLQRHPCLFTGSLEPVNKQDIVESLPVRPNKNAES